MSKDEVLISLLGYLGSYDTRVSEVLYGNIDILPSLKLERFVSAFPCTLLRDRFIGELLRLPDVVSDRNQFVSFGGTESHAFERIELPFNESHFFYMGKKVQVLFGFFHGATLLDPSLFEAGHEELLDDNRPNNYTDIDYTHNYSLSAFLDRISAGWPYDRSLLEDSLSESVTTAKMYGDLGGIGLGQVTLFNTYRYLLKSSKEYSSPVVKERIVTAARVVMLRYLEVIPVKFWHKDILRCIEKMPLSTERNQLFILLDQEKRRPVQTHELFFCEVPSADTVSPQQGLTLAAMAAIHEESVYPSGQRVVDQFMGSKLPAKGPLTCEQIVTLIPRSSPMRDQLLDRCEAPTIDVGTDILSLYWSPMAAYAKAFDISQAWLEASDGDQAILENILKITDEFPSLRRRMVHDWIDRFGIASTDYEKLLMATADSDAFDLYRGGALSGTRQTTLEQKAAACLASFASAITRDGYSLVSIQLLEQERKEASRDDMDVGKVDADHRAKLSAQQLANLYRGYIPLLPEKVLELIDYLSQKRRYQVHQIPFVDRKALPNPRFTRDSFVGEGLKDLQKWEAGKSFSRFMHAMGWEEAVMFYEELLLGADGVMQDEDLFAKIEGIFLEGVHLMLQEKGVLTSRAQHVKEGLQRLLKFQSTAVRGQIWARILAGIAQQQELGEIVREAARPLGAAAGPKLMQAIHSLTRGVDATLEQATGLALDQIARFTLFQSVQFLNAHGAKPFECHERYVMLGQGSGRVGIAGLGGAVEDSAYLLVHAGAADDRIVEGIVRFIHSLKADGTYFPLSASQFRGLVEATDLERLRGFENHREYRARYQGPHFPLNIPELYEAHDVWARFELARGKPYASLPLAEKPAVAAMTLGAALAQILEPVDGMVLINPEPHGGNIVFESPRASLVDCGLTELVGMEDIRDLFHVQAGYEQKGILGVAAAILERRKIDLGSLTAESRAALISGLRVYEDQARAQTPPELLVSGVVEITLNAIGEPMSSGLGALFRSLQHLAPLLRDIKASGQELGAAHFGITGRMMMQISALYTHDLDSRDRIESIERLATELKENASKASSPIENKIPKGLGIGIVGRTGGVQSLSSVLAESVDLAGVKEEGPRNGFLFCAMSDGSKRYVRPEHLRIQTQVPGGAVEFLTVDQWKKR